MSSGSRANRPAQCGYGCVGAVVGATYPEQSAELRAQCRTPGFWLPGFGSQGGTAHDVAGAFDADGLGAIVNNSRGIIFAHARREYAELWRRAVARGGRSRHARDDRRTQRADTPAGKLATAKRRGATASANRAVSAAREHKSSCEHGIR